MKKVLRRVALVASSLGLSFGWAGVAAANVSVGSVGDGSDTVIRCNVDETYTLQNNSVVAVLNNNDQEVESGEVEVEDNRNVGTSGSGGVMSGSASASHSAGTSLSVNNTGSTAAALGGSGSGSGGSGSAAPAVSVGNVGDGSDTKITYDYTRNTKVTNNTAAFVVNNSEQDVESGDVEVEDNRNVGGVSSGSASASSTSSTTVTISN